MSIVKLKKRFFVNSKIRAKNSVFYKESDPTTWVYDNYLNSKNIISLVAPESINSFDFDDQDEPSIVLEKVKDFINDVNNPKVYTLRDQEFSSFNASDKSFFRDYWELSKTERLSKLKNTVQYTDITNDLISDYRFRNHFKIKKTRSKFLVDDEYVYKKNTVKNNLYRNYYEKSLDFYKDLELGFCNYNTINFFSIDGEHSNCISYANPIVDSNKNLYDVYNSSFTLSLKYIFRSAELINNVNCLVHVPGIISLYVLKSNSNSGRIAATFSNKTYENILSITEFENRILQSDSNIENDFSFNKGMIGGNSNQENLKENMWSNISVKYDKEYGKVKIFINGNLYMEADISIDETTKTDSVILVGNKPAYDVDFISNPSNKFLFDSMISKDSINAEMNSIFNKDIYVPFDFSNDNDISQINEADFQKISKAEFCCGEISDFRIYTSKLEDDVIKEFKDNFVNNITKEIENGLEFYLPVFYVPLEIEAKQVINAASKRTNMSYNNYYNVCFANTCGGFILNSENYLVEFVKCSKPNVIINGQDIFNFYNNKYETNISDIVNFDNSFSMTKKGEKLFEVYNKNFKSLTQKPQDNFYYRNLMILPNDNGIPDVNFNIINDFLENYNLIASNKNVFKGMTDDIIPYNISVENIGKDSQFISDYVNYNNVSKLNSDLTVNFTDDNLSQQSVMYSSTSTGLSAFSNTLYHDSNITSYNSITGTNLELFNKSKQNYNKTESNPSIRNIFKNDIELSEASFIKEDIIYYKLPLPYSDINKDNDSNFITFIDIPTKFYDKKILKRNVCFKDTSFITNFSFTLKDNGLGVIHRADCKSKVADWNYVGHIFYNEGIASLNNPTLSYFSDTTESDFEIEFKAESFMHVKEINVPADAGIINNSQNVSYDVNLRHNEAAFNSEESFVYITDINLHDENFNIVARTKLARPIPKKDSDKMIFKLKMDY